MVQTMRWFGPNDPVSLADIRQAGCTGVVSGLHQVPVGEVWSIEEIYKRKTAITKAGMVWSVVESVPVHDAIKTQTGDFQQYIEHYKQTIKNLGACGVSIVTYNFMPMFDWIRTDFAYTLADGGKVLRFEKSAFIVFDVHILKRKGASKDYTLEELEKAGYRYATISIQERFLLQQNIFSGLSIRDDQMTIDKFRNVLDTYNGIDEAKLRGHLIYFLQEIIPVAEAAGVKMVIHPDDPPFSVLGLPSIVSTANQLAQIFEAVPSLSNGLCFCTGSFGVRPDNHLADMVQQFGNRINFIHLRSTKRNDKGDFYEDNHLEGDVDMFAVVKELLLVMEKRETSIHMRPDQGFQMLEEPKKKTNSGNPPIGRLRGLAELRGLEMGISQMMYR